MAAFGLLGWLLGGSVIPSVGRTVERASSRDVASRLAAWTRAPATTALHGAFDAAPDGWVVDWLSALRHSNHLVTWSGAPAPLALAAEALTDPAGGFRIDVAAPPGTVVALSDDGGTIDTVRVRGLGASVASPMVIGRVMANAGKERAAMALSESPRLRSIVVMGGASWEGKFIASALEERGWPVIARFSIAPNVSVGQSAPLVVDTARVAAVVATDSLAASQAESLERFVRSGGGLVLAGPSAASPRLRALAPGIVGARTRPVVRQTDTLRLGTTGFYPVASLSPGSVPLERRADGIALAARRVGAGRVLQVGYDDSWRWRMAGATGSEQAHREWWSLVVGSVAYVPHAPASLVHDESAPLARLVDRLGPAQAGPPPDAGGPPVDKRILVALIMTLLIIEWGSRRLRGLR